MKRAAMLVVVLAVGCSPPPPPPPPVDPPVVPLAQNLLPGTAEACGWKLLAAGGSLYWFDLCTGRLESVPVTGGPIRTVVPQVSDFGGGLVSDGAALYWNEFPLSTRATLQRLDLPNGTPRLMYTQEAMIWDPCLSGDRLAWWSPPLENQLDQRWSVWRAPTDGSAPPELVGRIYRPLSRLTCDRDHVYWTQEAPFDVLAHLESMPIAGGAAVELAVMPRAVSELHAAPDGTLAMLVYRSDDPNNPVLDLYRKAPGDAEPARLGTFHPGAALFIDDLGIAVADDARVLHYAAAGGAPAELQLAGPKGSPSITADATSVYWTGERGLFQAARP